LLEDLAFLNIKIHHELG